MPDGGWTPDTLKEYLDAKIEAVENATKLALEAVKDARTNSQMMINLAVGLAVAAAATRTGQKVGEWARNAMLKAAEIRP